MRTQRMEQDNSQSTPLSGSQPNLRDPSASRRTQPYAHRDQSKSDEEGQRSRVSSFAKPGLNSDSSQYNKARGPINDAVHSALDPIDPNHTAIPPDLLNKITSQITASVLESLKASQVTPPTAHAPPTATATDQMDSTSSVGGSPPIDRDQVYTPPSPYRASEEAAQTGSPTSPRKQTRTQVYPDSRRPPSPPFSHATLSEDSDAKESGPARSRVERPSVGDDATILERIWGKLFDEQGQSTTRLSQFLRGIAVHLIEDYEPKHSLVITPDKMQKYYEETKLPYEIYPWRVIFDDRTSSISRLFREVEVQHHLVQDRLNERPDIPGMTPIGFETWMTIVLKAHPDVEFERLAYTALHMPVSNPDDRKERFPKELSRRQFPKEADLSFTSRLQKLVLTHCGVKVPARGGSISERDNRPTQASTRTQETPTQAYASSQKPAQYDHPLSQTTTRSSVPDTDLSALRSSISETAVEEKPPIEVIPQLPIERERMPYVANRGSGKQYDNLDAQVLQTAESRQAQSVMPQSAKLTRSSSLNNGRPGDLKTRAVPSVSIHQKSSPMAPQIPTPIDIPPPSRTRTGSQYYRDGSKRGDRNRSPSITRSTELPHKSDGEVSYGSYHSSGSGDYPPSSRRTDNRYDHRPSFSAEPKDRDRDRDRDRERDYEPRQRYNSVSESDGGRYHSSKDYYTNKELSSGDEHHRPSNGGFVAPELQYSASQQYPPSAYRPRA